LSRDFFAGNLGRRETSRRPDPSLNGARSRDHRYEPGYWLGGNIDPTYLRRRNGNPCGQQGEDTEHDGPSVSRNSLTPARIVSGSTPLAPTNKAFSGHELSCSWPFPFSSHFGSLQA
jgi:hypothetical protein